MNVRERISFPYMVTDCAFYLVVANPPSDCEKCPLPDCIAPSYGYNKRKATRNKAVRELVLSRLNCEDNSQQTLATIIGTTPQVLRGYYNAKKLHCRGS